ERFDPRLRPPIPVHPVIDDPAEALDILLEELKRQKAAGVRRVSITADSLAALKALAGAPTPPAPALAAPAPVPAPVRPAVASSAAPKPAVAAPAAPIPDAPIFTLAAGTKAERMRALRQLVDGCAETRKHLVPPQRPLLGHGSLDAKVVFVGEAPTLGEMEAGQAFAGESGELLQKILGAAAIDPADCYFAPVMVWRPEPPTRYGKRPPTARELAFNLPYLRAQIDVIAPRVVVALGAQAFEALHGRTPTITQARGQWFDLGGVPLLATFHPNYLLHSPSASAKRTVWEDFLLLMEKLGLPISGKQRGFFAAK
ncbi:MAG: uracil-DNA glycosylase, partial [Opitutales bacterium]